MVFPTRTCVLKPCSHADFVGFLLGSRSPQRQAVDIIADSVQFLGSREDPSGGGPRSHAGSPSSAITLRLPSTAPRAKRWIVVMAQALCTTGHPCGDEA
jgi:hypothetical protein